MNIHFTKMHGIGNDYIYINCLDGLDFDPERLAILLSPRHFSVGADGVVLICQSAVADAKMRMFNADGSEGKMCGNAIRCVGKYLYDNKISPKETLAIETLSGLKYLTLTVENGRMLSASVDMGNAILTPKDIPLATESNRFNLAINGANYAMTCVSMGNPHAVTFIEEIDALRLEEIGPLFEHHANFPERVNTEFVEVLARNHVKMRVWERGSGETYACGTGACAVAVASILNGFCDFNTVITVDLLGGELAITVDDAFRVRMNGTATKVYEGDYNDEN